MNKKKSDWDSDKGREILAGLHSQLDELDKKERKETDKEIGINILDEKYINFKKWLRSISAKRGLESTLTIAQIYKMLDFLDGMENKMDEVILKAFKDKE